MKQKYTKEIYFTVKSPQLSLFLQYFHFAKGKIKQIKLVMKLQTDI